MFFGMEYMFFVFMLLIDLNVFLKVFFGFNFFFIFLSVDFVVLIYMFFDLLFLCGFGFGGGVLLWKINCKMIILC